MESLSDIWKLVIESIRSEVSDVFINLWFADLELTSLTDSSAVLLCSSEFKQVTINKNYLPLIKKHIRNVSNFDVEVTVKVKDKNKPEDFAGKESKKNTDEPVFYDPKNEESNSVKHRYTFKNFIVGNSNKLAHQAALAVANDPGQDYNPLFIYGPSGLGKTHLLYAITNKLIEENPDMRIVYVKGEEFTNQMIDSFNSKESKESFRDKYRKADVLLIDDIQFIANKAGTQLEVFNTFDALYECNRQIILVSDKPAKDINPLDERLRSRFESGLQVDIQPPDYELRLAILKSKIKQMQERMPKENKLDTIPNEVLTYIAENIKNNVRQLEGALKKVTAQSLLSGEPISLNLTISCIADMITASEPVSVTTDRIFDKVSKKYGISASDIKSKKQTQDVALARHIIVYIIKKMTDSSYPAIGMLLNRNYSTMISSYKLVEEKIKNSTLFEMEINQLISEIKDQ